MSDRKLSVPVDRYLKGVSYPATKEELIAVAEHNGAPHKVLEVLVQVENRVYDSVIDLHNEIAVVQ